MFGIIGFILILILVIVLIALTLVSNLIRFIFGWGRRTPKPHYEPNSHNSQSGNTYSSTISSRDSKQKKKVFDDSEGEYVEFEEVQ